MTRKNITLEWRAPRTKEERACLGMTRSDAKSAHIWFNLPRYRGHLASEVFFHEVTHAFLTFHGRKLSARQEEALARKLGEVASVVLR